MEIKEDAVRRIEGFKESFRRYPRTLLDAVPSAQWKPNHIRAITIRRRYKLPSQAAGESDFRSHLDRTLSAWGAYRPGGSVGGAEFARQIKRTADRVDLLGTRRIESIDWRTDEITEELWQAIAELKITGGDARLVSGTKAIHHLLPDLLPPMDNEYTSRFFFYRGAIYRRSNDGNRLEGEYFKAMFRAFAELARDLEPQLKRFTSSDDFNTSIPKTLDNAIIGFMISGTQDISDSSSLFITGNKLFDSLE